MSSANAKPQVRALPVIVPVPYRLFFLIVEPISTIVGAFYAHCRQSEYLALTDAASAPSDVPLGTSIAMSQLANLYLLFALNEALVLRATSDMVVWRALLFALLVADFGHLYSVSGHGASIFWDVTRWNAIDFGNIPFVYLGAAMRVAFLAGVGLSGSQSTGNKKTR